MKLFYFLFLFYPWLLNAQYSKNFDKVVKADTIEYYGFDFSKFTLTDPINVGEEEIVKKFFSPWINYFESASNINYMAIKYFDKIVHRGINSMERRDSLLPDRWVLYEKNKLKMLDIEALVKSYVLKEKSGIGYVAIVENFVKEEEIARVCYVLFDISTREVYFAAVTEGFAHKHMGMTRHWGSAMYNSFESFVRLYKKECKIHNKRK